MAAAGCLVVVGGTTGLGKEVAHRYAEQGREVVITGRDPHRAEKVASELGGSARGLWFSTSSWRQSSGTTIASATSTSRAPSGSPP